MNLRSLVKLMKRPSCAVAIVEIDTLDVQIDCNVEVGAPAAPDQIAAEKQQGLAVDCMGYESDGKSSAVSALSDASSDMLSQNPEVDSSVSPNAVHAFLHKGFRKKGVKIKDHFPILEDFIQVARIMISQPDRYNGADPQRHWLRKFLSYTQNELKDHG